MYTLNFNDVGYPKNFPEIVRKEQEKIRLALRNQGKTEEEVDKLVPLEPFVQVDDVERTIQAALSNYFQIKHFNQEKNTIVAPYDLRKKAAKINAKVSDSDDGTIELSDEQMDFLIEVLKTDMPYADVFIYLTDYLEKVKLESDTKK